MAITDNRVTMKLIHDQQKDYLNIVMRPTTRSPLISSAANYVTPTRESDKKKFSYKEEFSDKKEFSNGYKNYACD